MLEISDDGRGVDTAALRERLVATGRWIAPRAQLATDADVLDALLGTGVSMRGDADELAGRGIGLDLVRQTVARLGGEVKVTSTPGRGTTFSLRLPLSTSLAQAMLFKVGGQVYAIPARPRHRHDARRAGATTAPCRHEQLPVLRLEALLGHARGDRAPPGVVVSFAGKSAGLHRRQDRRAARDHHQAARPAARPAHAVRRRDDQRLRQGAADPRPGAARAPRRTPTRRASRSPTRLGRRWCSPAARSSSTIRARSARR